MMKLKIVIGKNQNRRKMQVGKKQKMIAEAGSEQKMCVSEVHAPTRRT